MTLTAVIDPVTLSVVPLFCTPVRYTVAVPVRTNTPDVVRYVPTPLQAGADAGNPSVVYPLLVVSDILLYPVEFDGKYAVADTTHFPAVSVTLVMLVEVPPTVAVPDEEFDCPTFTRFP